jgi:hypothetical protein
MRLSRGGHSLSFELRLRHAAADGSSGWLGGVPKFFHESQTCYGIPDTFVKGMRLGPVPTTMSDDGLCAAAKRPFLSSFDQGSTDAMPVSRLINRQNEKLRVRASVFIVPAGSDTDHADDGTTGFRHESRVAVIRENCGQSLLHRGCGRLVTKLRHERGNRTSVPEYCVADHPSASVILRPVVVVMSIARGLLEKRSS